MQKRTIVELIAAAVEPVPFIGPLLSRLIEISMNQDEEPEALAQIVNILQLRNNKERRFDVVAISACNYDHFIKVDKILADYECEIEGKEAHPGGSGANTICGLSKLGRQTSIVSCVKNDEEGQRIVQSFEDHKVDTQFLVKDNSRGQRTGIATILVELSGKRQILVEPGINDFLSRMLEERGLLEKLRARVRESRIVHLTSFANEEEMKLQMMILEKCMDKDTVVSLTPGALYTRKGLEKLVPLLAYTNIVFLYREQLDVLLGNSGIRGFRKDLNLRKKTELFFKWKARRGMIHPMLLVIKDSLKIRSGRIYENYISVAGSIRRKTSFFGHSNINFSIERVNSRPLTIVDTTGAGDAVAAGFMYGLLKGEKNVRICTNFAFVLATCASTRFGARAGLLDENTLEEEAKALR